MENVANYGSTELYKILSFVGVDSLEELTPHMKEFESQESTPTLSPLITSSDRVKSRI